MAHLSEGASPLEAQYHQALEIIDRGSEPGVKFIILPYFNSLAEVPQKADLYGVLSTFIENCESESTIAILTSPVVAADFCSLDEVNKYFKIWIAIKLETPIINEGQIDQQHCALVIFAKYKQSLKHTLTRIGYSYCPSCDKTTKDYGGKKHLYHEFGTMMSDVWKDISVNVNAFPDQVLERLSCLFGLPNYKHLDVYDLRDRWPRVVGATNFKIFQNVVPHEEQESNLLIGDCIEKLKTIPANSIDFCFADPPYNIKKKYNNWDDGLDIQEYFKWCDEWLNQLARVLKPGCTVAILNIPKWCIRHFKYLNTILDFQDWIVWEGLSIPSKNIVPLHYSILCFSKGQPRELPGKGRQLGDKLEKESLSTLSEGYCIRPSCVKSRKALNIQDKEDSTNLWWGIHRLMHNSRRVDHPCQLPPALMYRLISLFTKSGEIVLDPFNGAGTTTLCAEIMGRRYLGIELSDYYHKMALERHSDIVAGIDPFRKNNIDTPKVKNSRVDRLDKQKYKVSKKVLQLEVKQIAYELGRLPTKEELFARSTYPAEYFESYFVNWGEVYAAAKTTGMSESRTQEKQIKLGTQLKLL